VHPLLRPGYAAVGQLARALTIVAPAGDAKLLRSLRARRGLLDRYRNWGRTGRAADRPLLWIHAPSVGEGLQARPVVELVRSELPRAQIAYTHFSPSAERFARSLSADFADYLPFDTAHDMRVAIDSLRPSALVFSKLDLWPAMVDEASRRGVRLGMISATLAAGSGRRGPLGRALLHDAYARLDVVGAIDSTDAERLVDLGVRRTAIHVTGDTRYDQVWARAEGVDRRAPQLATLVSTRPTIVAGSTWPADEKVLLPALHRVRVGHPELRVIIAPHEPTVAHLDPIERWARETGARSARLGSTGAADADVVVVDRVGVLGDLYALGDIAYVGGGFHAAGLHSVLEPAAFGIPVIFGPRSSGSRDAGLLVTQGGGAQVDGAAALAALVEAWLVDAGKRADIGARARGMVANGLGAARATYELVRALLPG
jgi:3-deoxy-D-manno-octulosonic-acid transferase